MQNTLYLDTARMGQMSPSACAASMDFARFANEHGCTLYCSELLQHGFDAWHPTLKQRYAGLKHWQGVAPFKSSLRRVANSDVQSNVLLAARSASLMKFAAKLFSGPCRNVMITDTCWPVYRNILKREFENCDCSMTAVSIRRSLLYESMPSDQVVSLLAEQFERRRCDGLFLPLVDNLGVRLPIERIADAIKPRCELRFVVVDGAQAIGHIPLDLHNNYCDLLIAGSHKWLRAFHSMGIGFFCNSGSRQYVADSLRRWTASGAIDDPLMRFVDELENGRSQPFGETVHVAPLIAASAAATDALVAASSVIQESIDLIRMLADSLGWRLLSAQSDMASRIMLSHLVLQTTQAEPQTLWQN